VLAEFVNYTLKAPGLQQHDWLKQIWRKEKWTRLNQTLDMNLKSHLWECFNHLAQGLIQEGWWISGIKPKTLSVWNQILGLDCIMQCITHEVKDFSCSYLCSYPV
jgi:hypothetical protein